MQLAKQLAIEKLSSSLVRTGFHQRQFKLEINSITIQLKFYLHQITSEK